MTESSEGPEAINLHKARLEEIRNLGESYSQIRQASLGQRAIIEWCLVNSFIQYELIIASSFRHCMIKHAGPHVIARDSAHTEQILKSFNSSGERFLDWSDPARVREKSDIYLGAENVIGLAIASYGSQLAIHRSLRNHLSHRSTESTVGYRKAVRSILTVDPEVLPEVHEFLTAPPTKGPAKGRILLSYLIEAILGLAEELGEGISSAGVNV